MEYMPQYSPIVMMALLGMCGLPVAGVIFAFVKPEMAKFAIGIVGAAAGFYLLLLLSLSLTSQDKVLEQGQLKYFCEMDCHQVYSVMGVRREGEHTVVTIRVWFDEKTIGSQRGNSPLTVDERHIELVDNQGHSYRPAPVNLQRQLRPGESFTTDLMFPTPAGAHNLRLLISAPQDLPSSLLLGHENSLLHKKIWFKVS